MLLFYCHNVQELVAVDAPFSPELSVLLGFLIPFMSNHGHWSLHAAAPGGQGAGVRATWSERHRLRVTVARVLGLVVIVAITNVVVAPRQDVVEVRASVLPRAPTSAPNKHLDDPSWQRHLGQILSPAVACVLTKTVHQRARQTIGLVDWIK